MSTQYFYFGAHDTVGLGLPDVPRHMRSRLGLASLPQLTIMFSIVMCAGRRDWWHRQVTSDHCGAQPKPHLPAPGHTTGSQTHAVNAHCPAPRGGGGGGGRMEWAFRMSVSSSNLKQIGDPGFTVVAALCSIGALPSPLFPRTTNDFQLPGPLTY
jgi:hypothetical protein